LKINLEDSYLKDLNTEDCRRYLHHARRVPVTTGCGWRDGLQLQRAAVNALNKEPQTADEGWFSSLWDERGANNTSP
jgi:hypothetical protein